MAKPRAIIEFPPFLLPRITWSQVAAKGAASQLRQRVPSNHNNRPIPLPLQRLPQTRAVHLPSLSKQVLAVCQRTAGLERIHQQPISSSVDAPPIRHNGVYVAAFKPAKRAFSTTRSNATAHHFDTLKFVQRLKGEGFSEDQAAAMMRVLNDVIEESIQNLTRTMVLKEGVDKDKALDWKAGWLTRILRRRRAKQLHSKSGLCKAALRADEL